MQEFIQRGDDLHPENMDLRVAIMINGIHWKDVAKEMKVSHTYLSRVLGKPLTPYMRARILQAINELKDDERQGDRFA